MPNFRNNAVTLTLTQLRLSPRLHPASQQPTQFYSSKLGLGAEPVTQSRLPSTACPALGPLGCDGYLKRWTLLQWWCILLTPVIVVGCWGERGKSSLFTWITNPISVSPGEQVVWFTVQPLEEARSSTGGLVVALFVIRSRQQQPNNRDTAHSLGSEMRNLNSMDGMAWMGPSFSRGWAALCL